MVNVSERFDFLIVFYCITILSIFSLGFCTFCCYTCRAAQKQNANRRDGAEDEAAYVEEEMSQKTKACGYLMVLIPLYVFMGFLISIRLSHPGKVCSGEFLSEVYGAKWKVNKEYKET